jgi:hypothetical protein
MSDCFTAFSHVAVSLRMLAANSSGELATIS